MLLLLFFTSTFIISADQDNIFRSTINLFKKNNTPSLEETAHQLNSIVLGFYTRHSITNYNEHHTKVSSLLDAHFKTCRQGSSFNSLLYHDELFLKQVDTAGSEEWSILSAEEKAFFSSSTFEQLNYIDSKRLLYTSFQDPLLHSKAANAYIISLAKP